MLAGRRGRRRGRGAFDYSCRIGVLLKIILFGSQASGTAGQESDIDLLVVLDEHHAAASLTHWDRCGKLLELFQYRSFGLDALIIRCRPCKKPMRGNGTSF
ncbi:MAG: nucleotidyltransferase domain-containing protein [Anaerolineales bacterium]